MTPESGQWPIGPSVTEACASLGELVEDLHDGPAEALVVLGV
jgi:hypothetical protein